MQDKIYSMLGLAAKAGKVTSGGFLTEKAVKERRAKLVIIAADASAGSADTIRNKCDYYKVPCRIYGLKEDLGNAIGKEDRTCAAVLDQGFAGSILKKIDEAGETQKVIEEEA